MEVLGFGDRCVKERKKEEELKCSDSQEFKEVVLKDCTSDCRDEG